MTKCYYCGGNGFHTEFCNLSAPASDEPRKVVAPNGVVYDSFDPETNVYWKDGVAWSAPTPDEPRDLGELPAMLDRAADIRAENARVRERLGISSDEPRENIFWHRVPVSEKRIWEAVLAEVAKGNDKRPLDGAIQFDYDECIRGASEFIAEAKRLSKEGA